jgi:hypothetical protein
VENCNNTKYVPICDPNCWIPPIQCKILLWNRRQLSGLIK